MARLPEPNLSTSADVGDQDVGDQSVIIDHLSASGEGVVRMEGSPLFVPMTLPGETVRLDDAGRLMEVLSPSSERADPFCSAFGRCGGCAMQHLTIDSYARWKQESLQRTMAREGFDIAVEPVVIAHGEGRRRAIVHVRFGQDGAKAGFMAARSHDLQSLETCPVLVPALKEVFAVARAVTVPLKGRNKPLDVQVTATLAGLDVDVRGHGEPDERERLKLIDVATRLDLARLSIHRSVIVERRPPVIDVGGTMVTLPPRAFLQATAEAEQILGDLVLDAVGKAKTVADLFCGVGPFALRLAQKAKTYAADEGKEAVTALDRAAKSRQGLKPIVAETRDLFRRPLLPQELNAFETVVMDPPRAGAEAQTRQIAASRVKQVISVSCDLQSFIRDGLILRAAGFKLTKLTPVDQFAWSRHIELVGDFRR